jgi:L-methionine (R)-S-oxide reductase
MDQSKKSARYARLYEQLSGLIKKTADPDARMATIVAVLHNKMEYFFWTGFYLLREGELTVKTYQGPLACQVLKKNTGVCWAGINQEKTIVVQDVHQFPGHIACDSRSNSEIVVPLFNREGQILGVLDVDSESLGSFDEEDAANLERIVRLIYSD